MGPWRTAVILIDGTPSPADHTRLTAAALVLVGVALLVWPAAGWPGRRVPRTPPVSGHGRFVRVPNRTRRGGLAAAAAVAVGVLVGVPAVLLAATAAAAFAAGRWLPQRAAASRTEPSRGAEATSLAGLLDLLATAMTAGLPLPQAISAIADLEESPAGAILAEVGSLLALGVPPLQAWRSAADDRDLAPLAAAAVRAAIGGVTLADAAREVAREIRDRARAESDRAAARAEVAMTAPLALCFLPAFLCLGLAPVVIGLVRGLHLF